MNGGYVIIEDLTLTSLEDSDEFVPNYDFIDKVNYAIKSHKPIIFTNLTLINNNDRFEDTTYAVMHCNVSKDYIYMQLSYDYLIRINISSLGYDLGEV